MKERASFTFDKQTIDILDKLIESGEYRNRSHVVEHAIKILGTDKPLEKNVSEKELDIEKIKEKKDLKQIKDFLSK